MQGGDPREPRGTDDLLPRPDPTSLTTEQLRRELGHATALTDAKFSAVDARLDSMDKASELLHSNLTTVVFPHDLISQRETLTARIDKSDSVNIERFARVETQFVELDKRNSQAKIAADTGIAAAMAAAEKAVGENNRSFAASTLKSETTTGDALRSLDSQLKTEIRATNDKVAMLASRQDRNEGSSASLIAIGSAALAVVALMIAGYSAFHSTGVLPQPTVQYVPAPTAVPAPVTVPR
jgi:hypothetical protein